MSKNQPIPQNLRFVNFTLLKIVLFLSAISLSKGFGQTDSQEAITESLDQILKEITYRPERLNFNKLKRIKRAEKKNIPRSDDLIVYYDSRKQYVELLFQLEKDNYSQDKLTPITIRYINIFDSLRELTVMMRYVLNNLDSNSPVHHQLVREKLIHVISDQMKVIGDNTQPWYNYNTVEKEFIKGIQIESSNDLFRPGIIQGNSDVDYTGSLKISITTDFFKMNGLWPTQSYQNIIYGAEVYTPFFKDSTVFFNDTSYSEQDRPHASFQYIGYEFNGLSSNYKSRWSFSTKAGIIGTRFGYNFQYFLHRDISLSPYPYGWDSQIGNNGRLGLQLNGKYEYLLRPKLADLDDNQFKFYPSGSLEFAVGHYMTYGELGFNLSNKNFKSRNHDNILIPGKVFTGVNDSKLFKCFWDLNLSGRIVVHNTMLEGFGMFKTNETNQNSFAEESKYKLDKDQVRRLLLFTNIVFGAQFSKFNLFYKYSIKSPEVKIDDAVEINNTSINERWHNYGTLGFNFLL